MNTHTIYSINGPVVTVNDATSFKMLEMVYVGPNKLLGEVIQIQKSKTIVQVYEDTVGLKQGDPVYPTGEAISVILGPGLISNIYDGIQRPLLNIEMNHGHFIPPGSQAYPLDQDKKWDVTILLHQGDHVTPGMFYAEVYET